MAFNPKRLIPIGVIALLAAGGIYLDRVRSASHASLSGVWEAQPSTLASRIGGRVHAVLVDEGQFVKAGTPLVVLEAEPDQNLAAASAAQAEALEAQADLTKQGPRDEDIRRQAAVVAEASASLRRLQNGALPEEITIARQRRDQAASRLQELKNGPRKEDIAAARASMMQAEAALRAAERGPTPEQRRQAQAAYDSAKVQAEQARKDADRSRRLAEQGAISKSQAENDETRARSAELAAEQARQALQNLKTAPEELAQSRQAFERTKAQYEVLVHGTRPEEVKQAQSDVASAQASLDLLLRGSRSEDIAAAKARLAQAQATLDGLRAGSREGEIRAANATARAGKLNADASKLRIDDRTIVAPTDGIVDRVLVADGDLLAAGSPVVRFSDPHDIWLRIFVPERDLAKIKVGSIAQMRIDGIEQVIAGEIESIATQGEFTPANLQSPEERGKQVFAVRIRLQNPDERVKAGMAATVTGFGS